MLFMADVVCVLPVTVSSESRPSDNLRKTAEPGMWPEERLEQQASRDEGIQPCER